MVGGPYAAFGGKDASRGLATFSVTASEVEYDDLSDLTPPEMDSVREWEMQFKGETIASIFSRLTFFFLMIYRKIRTRRTLVEGEDLALNSFFDFT